MLDARDLPHGQVLRTDVCIVGAGAAGISMALDLIDSRLHALVLESGGTKASAEAQDLYAGSVTDPRLHSPPDRYRQRCLGGSTTIWDGRCVPFDPIDFERRPYVPHSGWPIRYDDLAPYYVRAAELCDIGEFAYTAEQALPAGSRPMLRGLDSRLFTQNRIERFSLPTDFGTRYGERLRRASNVCVLLHANLTALDLNAEGTAVAAARASTLTGKSICIHADHFVLATGGLETTRLLLANRSVHRQGIGNDHDQVGRYYMCHIAGSAGRFVPRRADAVWHGYDRSAGGIYCRRRLALTAGAQRRWQVGNFIARLHHPRIAEPSHHTGAFGGVLRHLANIVNDPVETGSFLLHRVKYRALAERKLPSVIVAPKTGIYSLDFHAEQQPNPLSRVTLGEDLDALGMRRIRIDWRYLPADVETVACSFGLLAGELTRSNVGMLNYDPEAVEAEIIRHGACGGHHIGTARMGTDPRCSVVDPDCRVHGVSNLFIAGAATFPTSSQANPTLTVVALALRLAAHIRQICARSASHQVSGGTTETSGSLDRRRVANAA